MCHVYLRHGTILGGGGYPYHHSQFTVNKNGLSQVTGQPIHNSQLINKAIHGSQE